MNEDKIIMGHGSGGKRMDDLIRNVFLNKFQPGNHRFLPDSYVFDHDGNNSWAMTTDSFVVDPLFFPGGDIGRIAVSGTVNDLSVSGAIPLFLSASFIIEEGFSITQLQEITGSMAREAEKAGVSIVTGDTKVVQKGKADKVFINTTGIGSVIPALKDISSGNRIKPGDVIILNGPVGEHAVAVMCEREEISFESPVYSDVAPLNHLIQDVLKKTDDIAFMRDVTRGGLATVAKEIVENQSFGILLKEEQIPVPEMVQSYCDIFGYDPLYLANEGKVMFIVKPAVADMVIDAMQKHPQGKKACIIGEVTDKHPGKLYLQTFYKGTRVLDKLSGEQLPRIC
jgi:hydrogenase expression/formation protein HypE